MSQYNSQRSAQSKFKYGSGRLEERSRLVRVLTGLSEQKLLAYEANLAERLGHLVGVSGSMNLARGLRLLPQQPTVGGATDYQQTQAVLLTGRAQIINRIVQSFSEGVRGGETQNALPSLASGLRVEALKSFEPYQRFYSTHQLDMGVAIKTLRQRLRQMLATCSTELHQLAVLDQLVDESLEAHTRKLFNVMPRALEKRFKLCRASFPAIDSWDGEDTTWLTPFLQDMRELLLAEFDMRFQPLLGLLEAQQEHLESDYD